MDFRLALLAGICKALFWLDFRLALGLGGTVGLEEAVVREYIRIQQAEEQRQEQMTIAGIKPGS